MLQLNLTKGSVSLEVPVAAGAKVTAEGQALVADTLLGVFGVKPSTGAAGEKFVGVAVSQQMTLAFLPKVEVQTQPVGNTITLDRTPAAGTLAVYDLTAAGVVPVGAGGWTLAGRVVTLQAGTVGHELQATYRYAPTVNEARSIQGDVYPGGPAGEVVGQVGAIKNGVVYTSEFDTTVNWKAANPIVTLGANGLFTVGGTGTVLDAIVIANPTEASPYLGLLLNA